MILLVGEVILLIAFEGNFFVRMLEALHLLHDLLEVAFFITYALEFVCCMKTIKTVDTLVIRNLF